MSKMRPRIVVLDGHAVNPGDLSWEGIASLGECVVHARTGPGEVIARGAGARVLLTNKTVLGRREMEALPRLEYIGVLATGYDVVDLDAARERGVPVCNVPGYSTASVAQMTLALLLELALSVGEHSREVHRGRWIESPDFSYHQHPLVELDGLTLGVVGYGAIGSAVTRLGIALGMRVLVTSRRRVARLPRGARHAGLAQLFAGSDAVTLHCPLTPETRGLVDAALLSTMKPTAWLINTSRGPVVREDDLARALKRGVIAGAALDVLEKEPMRPDNPLLGAPNCFITPHIAWATRASRRRLLDETAENIRAFLRGETRNDVTALPRRRQK